MASTPANELDEMEEVDTDGVVGCRRDRVEFRRDRVRIPTLLDSSAVASDFRRGRVRFPTRSRPNSGVVTSGSLLESRRDLAAGLRPGGWLATERVANGDEARRSTVTRHDEVGIAPPRCCTLVTIATVVVDSRRGACFLKRLLSVRNVAKALSLAKECQECVATLADCSVNVSCLLKFYSHRLLNKLPRFKEEMETVMRKVQQKYKKLREEMGRWDELQSGLLSHFHSASSIIDRLRVSFFSVLHIVKNFIVWEEFHAVVLSLEKIARDANQLVKGGSALTPQQMKLQIGLWPSLDYCLEGLRTIYEMHQSEYTLKLSLVTSLTLKSTSAEIAAMNQLLVDQPNIPKDQVQAIFDRIFAEEIC
ncbi:hypothetical protein ZIOFF_028095 [Zingiber officinale]|uniref:Uncharacterized protein n=1 Tax=Zingiber officinale TaxID=94328 RepID=A0A8J5LDL5_ZINOF|nr:hypothetical protein ZIOFF_028095 [Zingiber officinale]